MTHDQKSAKGGLRTDQDRLIFDQGFSFSGYERDPLYLNLGARGFLDVSGCSGIDSVSDGRAAVFADFDNDGDPDVFLTTLQGQGHLLFRNNVGQASRWLRVALEGAKGRDAFSAVVRARTSAGTLSKLHAGGAGYLSQHDPRLLLGLGSDEVVASVEVTWPGGTRETFPGPFAARSSLVLREGRGRADSVPVRVGRLPDPLSSAQLAALGLRLKLGEPLPELALTSLDGSRVPLRSILRPGRQALVNLWATWCTPCRREMPELEAIRAPLAARGIDIVGVSVDTEAEAPVAAFARERVRYPVYRLDTQDLGKLFATDEVTVPVSLRLAEDGRLLELIPGWSDAARQKLRELLGELQAAARP